MVKRKRVEEELDILRTKKRLIEDDIKSLNTASDELAEKTTICLKPDEMRLCITKSGQFQNYC